MLTHSKVNRSLPSQTADTNPLSPRVTRYGEQLVVPLSAGAYGLADEGSYFKATNPTVSTGIAHALTQTWAATTCLFVLRNTDSENAKRIYLDYLRLHLVSASPTAATSIEAAVTVDNTNRFSSGGSSITPKNCNMDSSQATIAALDFGAVTAAAASGSVRLLSRMRFPHRAAPAIVQGDCLLFNFGRMEMAAINQAGSATPATAPTLFVASLGPVVLGGGDSCVFHLWYPAIATTAPSYEFEMGWWER